MAEEVSTQMTFLKWNLIIEDDIWNAYKELSFEHNFVCSINNVTIDNELRCVLTVNVNPEIGHSITASLHDVLVLIGESLESLSIDAYNAKYGG